MVTPTTGAVVLVPFPFSDLSQAKLRPAVVLADAGRGDWILCQITSNPLSGLFLLSCVGLTAADTWTKKADMPTARWILSTSVIKGKIYAIGGALTGDVSTAASIVEEYDPATDTWTRKTDMPTPRWGLSTSVR